MIIMVVVVVVVIIWMFLLVSVYLLFRVQTLDHSSTSLDPPPSVCPRTAELGVRIPLPVWIFTSGFAVLGHTHL